MASVGRSTHTPAQFSKPQDIALKSHNANSTTPRTEAKERRGKEQVNHGRKIPVGVTLVPCTKIFQSMSQYWSMSLPLTVQFSEGKASTLLDLMLMSTKPVRTWIQALRNQSLTIVKRMIQ